MKYRVTIISSVLAVAATFGCSKNSTATANEVAPQASSPAVANEAGIIAVIANEDGFAPSQIEVKRGQKTTLRFTRTTDKTCATAVVFPELSLERPLPLNQPVDIVIPSDEPRTLNFQCGMGMYKSRVVIN